ncbi:MAG TPA: amino acid adenylation domain-containing protein [Candidatus Nitrosotalea sp.]|nr:amino acid adenylation domain-containing protein [Candidatus Nitrosotalea sp.]
MTSAAPFRAFAKDAIEQSIGARFEEQVRRYPERLAIKSQRDAWSYAELNRIANRVAHAILAARGPAEEPVALVLEQGALLPATILGALKAGKIYVPLDPTFPRVRLGEMVEDAQATLVLADSRTRRLATEMAPGPIPVLDASALGAGVSSENPGLGIPPDANAYIYYTSGSTGRPKGVVDTHRNVLHNVMRYTNSLRISPEDRLTLLQGPSFSGAVSSMFAALLNGAAVFPFDVHREGVDRIAGWLRDEAITIYHSVPVLFRHMAMSGEPFPALRVIRLEGDRASGRDIELYQKHFSATCVLVNGLGATECGIVRQYFVRTDTPGLEGIVPIGYPVEDMEILVLDEAGHPVDAGQVGEIAVRSRYLVPGYWRRPELTSAAFTVDPADPGLRTYRTGDLGRMRSDGCLEHLGRTDFQAKIRGNRVEVAEVEAALLGVGAVKEVAVATRQDGSAEPRLVAYVVPGSHTAPTVSELRRHLAARLPDYMIPSAYVILEALPLDANGKVDRRALPAPDGRRPELDEGHVEPRTLLEHQLARIWEAVLGIHPVGILDSFFDLGGSSLLAVQMMDQVERVLHRKVPLSVMLAGATIADLASAIQEEAVELRAPIVPIQTGGGRPPFFFLHGDYLSGGFFCGSLARHLGPDQPFYALPPCGIAGQPAPSSYEAMAARHLEALRSVQPEGPYRLGGLCNGGLVAFEMARLLEAQGETVDLLVPVAALPAHAQLDRFWLWRLMRWVAVARGHGPDRRLDWFMRLRDVATRVERLTPRQRATFVLAKLPLIPRRLLSRLRGSAHGRTRSVLHATAPAPGPPPEAGEERRRLRATYLRIDDEYVPRPYSGRLALFWPADDPVAPAEAARRWARIAPQVDVRVVSGTHFTCLTDHVQSAARELRHYLQEPRRR